MHMNSCRVLLVRMQTFLFLSCFLSLIHESAGTRRMRAVALGTKSFSSIEFPRRYLSLDSEESASGERHPPSATAFLLSHPLFVEATISFFVGVVIGILIFILWRFLILLRHFLLERLFCLTRIVAEDEEDDAVEVLYDGASVNAPSIFSPMLRRPESLLFIRKLQQEGLLPFPIEVIGRGGCGEVYKAEFPVGSQTLDIAIKKIDHPAAVVGAADLCREDSELLHFRMRQIRSEILTAGRMRHPNLLRLLAHIPNLDCHYLVYEYMPHGSLHDLLRRGLLEWPLRYKIALGVAAGLVYLHMEHRPRVIHRDLKPANILLDRDLNARIADFGLAKLVQCEKTASLTAGTAGAAAASNNVAGTVGYIAPEYYQTMTCTDKCDVYSFGVILAVLVTGRFPSDRFFEETDEMCIVGWVRRVLREETEAAMAAAIDRRLMGSGFEEQMMLMLKVACFCTYDDPNERPNSRDVHCMLSQIIQ